MAQMQKEDQRLNPEAAPDPDEDNLSDLDGICPSCPRPLCVPADAPETCLMSSPPPNWQQTLNLPYP